MNQTKEWHVFKILIVSLIPFVGFWLFLQLLSLLFNSYIDAGFISAVLSFHAIIAVFLYIDFRTSLRGKLPLTTIRTLFKKSLTVAFIGDAIVLTLLGILFYVFDIGFEAMLLWSPIFLNVFLFLALRKCLPDSVKQQIKLRQQSRLANISFNDITEEHIPQPLSLDMAELQGMTNPSSPNYIYNPEQHH